MNSSDFKPAASARGAADVDLVLRLCADHELDKFRELMTAHHYLEGGRSAGDTLRYVAEIDGEWVALLTKLKHREAWIGWGIGLRKARLKLVVQNRRFCLLLKPGRCSRSVPGKTLVSAAVWVSLMSVPFAMPSVRL